MTASWLVQMGWRDAVVLEGGIEGHALEQGMPTPPVLGLEEARVEGITPEALAAALARGEADVVDVSLSRTYRSGHLPGARHGIRARFGRDLTDRSRDRLLVVTADDAALARLAAADLTEMLDAPVRCLEGGNGGWSAAGYPLTAADPAFLDAPDDVRIRVNEDEGGMEKAMNDYLTWEIGAGRRRRPRRHRGLAAHGTGRGMSLRFRPPRQEPGTLGAGRVARHLRISGPLLAALNEIGWMARSNAR